MVKKKPCDMTISAEGGGGGTYSSMTSYEDREILAMGGQRGLCGVGEVGWSTGKGPCVGIQG